MRPVSGLKVSILSLGCVMYEIPAFVRKCDMLCVVYLCGG